MKTRNISLHSMFACIPPQKNGDLHYEIKKQIESEKKICVNSCYNVALFIAKTDGEITSKIQKAVQDTLTNGYSQKYREIMDIGEHTLNHFLDISCGKSGFINFTNKNGELCHTAYIKALNEELIYYHANYSCIDKHITEQYGFECMGYIEKTNITYYVLNNEMLTSLTDFMQQNQWRAAFSPADALRK